MFSPQSLIMPSIHSPLVHMELVGRVKLATHMKLYSLSFRWINFPIDGYAATVQAMLKLGPWQQDPEIRKGLLNDQVNAVQRVRCTASCCPQCRYLRLCHLFVNQRNTYIHNGASLARLLRLDCGINSTRNGQRTT